MTFGFGISTAYSPLALDEVGETMSRVVAIGRS